MTAAVPTWIIAAVAVAGVIARPFRWPEAVWAVGGAVLLVVLGLLPLGDAWRGVGKGLDVYLFLTGMMLLSETARREGLFDAAAALAVRWAAGSSLKLFLLVYAVGALVTAFLSNDAAAVVLTPAVYAAARKARVEPLPFLFICAFIANAASFALPISNPANLVLYADRLPPLGRWMERFALPSAAAVVTTCAALYWTQRGALEPPKPDGLGAAKLSPGGWTALAGLGLTAVALLAASSFGVRLGWPTAVMGGATAAVVLVRDRAPPWPLVKGVSWSILPLVADLFVLVEALQETGVVHLIADLLQAADSRAGAAVAGAALALACNAMNNLPAGLIASAAVAGAHASRTMTDALLIGVDLGPNLSVTGSLATLLWLAAIRREGQHVDAWTFLKVGALVTPPALAAALLARLTLPP